MKKYKLFFCFVLVLLVSCKKEKSNKNDLTLTLLNKEVKAYVLKGHINDYPSEIYSDKEYYLSKGGNVIEYKIKNNSKFTYVLTRVDGVFDLKLPFSGLSGLDVLIKDSDSLKLWSNPELDNYSVEFRDFEIQNDKYILSNYQNRNIDSLVNVEGAKINDYYKRNTFKIYPEEVIYFKTFVNLPNSFNEVNYNFEMYQFDYSKDYTFELELHFGIHNSQLYLLSDIIEKNNKENNFKVFKGVLNSEKIPIHFVE